MKEFPIAKDFIHTEWSPLRRGGNEMIHDEVLSDPPVTEPAPTRPVKVPRALERPCVDTMRVGEAAFAPWTAVVLDREGGGWVRAQAELVDDEELRRGPAKFLVEDPTVLLMKKEDGFAVGVDTDSDQRWQRTDNGWRSYREWGYVPVVEWYDRWSGETLVETALAENAAS